jgi:hypothetical protein
MRYKTIIARVVCVASLLLFAKISNAVPLYYTFTGTVDYIEPGGTAVIQQYGLGLGSTVSHTILVDLQGPGTLTQNQGFGDTITTWLDSDARDFFYTDYIAGDQIQLELLPGYKEFNYGYDNFTTNAATLLAGTGIVINKADNTGLFTSWTIGDTVTISNRFSYNGAVVGLYGQGTLTSISVQNPFAVPEPASLSLLCLGILGMTIVRKRVALR